MTSTTPRSTRTLEALALTAAGVLTAGTAMVIGWVEVSLHLGGTTDRDDYAMATGAYAAGAILLLLVPAIVALMRLSWLSVVPTLVLAGILGHQAMTSAAHLATATPGDVPGVTWVDGARLMIEIPWNWPLPLILVVVLVVRLATPTPTPAGVPTA